MKRLKDVNINNTNPLIRVVNILFCFSIPEGVFEKKIHNNISISSALQYHYSTFQKVQKYTLLMCFEEKKQIFVDNNLK